MKNLIDNLNLNNKSSYLEINVLVLIFFFITLDSFYYDKISMSPFPILGVLGLFFLALFTVNRLNKRIFFKFLILFMLAIYLKITMSIFDLFVKYSYSTLFASIINLIAMLSVFMVFYKDKEKLCLVLGSVVALHLFFYYLQVVVWFATDYYLDYVALLSDEYSVYSSRKGLILFNERIPRFTGLFHEPGTYSTSFFAIFSLYYLIRPKVNFFLILALFSLFFSMSLLGGILASSIIFIVIFKRFRISLFFKFFPIIAIILFFFINANYERFDSNYLGLDYRLNAIKNIFDTKVFLLGDLSNETCGMNVHITFATTLMCKGGLFYGIIFFAFLFFSNIFTSFTSFLFVSMVLISKIKIQYPLFWIYIVIIFVISNFASKQSNKIPKERSLTSD